MTVSSLLYPHMLFVSGQIPIDPATGEFAGSDITTQTNQSLTNVRNILSAAGYGLMMW